MDEKLQKAIAVILADELEPDRISGYVQDGIPPETADVLADMGVGADELVTIKALFEQAQSYNGSRGWWTTLDKYAPDDERETRAIFGDNGEIVGIRY